jgi:hypothetical protein
MLSLLKKKSESVAAPAGLRWHPDFRLQAKLPDIKVVRTAFFINGAAALVVIALATYLGYNEWQLRALNAQVAEADAQIARQKPASLQAVGLFKKFQAEEARIKEVDAFVSAKPSLSELIFHLSEVFPANLALDNLEWREAGLLLRFSVKGAPDVASGHATAFRDQLAADKTLSFFGEPTIANLATNPTTGRLVGEIMLPAKGKK